MRPELVIAWLTTALSEANKIQATPDRNPKPLVDLLRFALGEARRPADPRAKRNQRQTKPAPSVSAPEPPPPPPASPSPSPATPATDVKVGEQVRVMEPTAYQGGFIDSSVVLTVSKVVPYQHPKRKTEAYWTAPDGRKIVVPLLVDVDKVS